MSLNKANTNDFIELRGRSGLNYYDERGQGYFIDSEIIVNDNYDYAIYIDSIILLDTKQPPSKEVKDAIIERVQYLCEEKGMKPHWYHDNE